MSFLRTFGRGLGRFAPATTTRLGAVDEDKGRREGEAETSAAEVGDGAVETVGDDGIEGVGLVFPAFDVVRASCDGYIGKKELKDETANSTRQGERHHKH